MSEEGEKTHFDAHHAKQIREEAFDRELRAYIRADGFRFGGIVNLCTTIATICEQEAENQRCPQMEIAAREFEDMAQLLDVRHEHLSREDWESGSRQPSSGRFSIAVDRKDA